LSERRFDAVVTALEMPRLDGFQPIAWPVAAVTACLSQREDSEPPVGESKPR
jgi:hypothetical protein